MAVSTRTRRTISTVLAILLAVESVSAVAAAAATTTVSHPLPDQPPAGQVLAAEAVVRPALPTVATLFSAPAGASRVVEPAQAPVKVAPKATKSAKATKATKATKPVKATKATKATTKKIVPKKTTTRKTTTRKVATAASFSGANRVWIPELGINRSVRAFPCDRQRPPDSYMYRWGCAGTNNVYLMGHAYSVMKGLYNAYVGGRLHKGMKAYYAGRDGKVHTYTVRWWKKTLPTTEAAWAWAAQSAPSMTLQTCVGANSQYRLMVRLVEVGG